MNLRDAESPSHIKYLLLTLSLLKGITIDQEGSGPNIMEYLLAAPEDIPILAEMRWENRQERGHESQPAPENKADFIQVCQQFLEEAFYSGHWYIWVAAEEAELVAHIYVHMIEKVPRLSSFHPCFGYMTNVYTRPSWRGEGVGGRLLEAVVDWAKEEGMEFLFLWPSEESSNFYSKAGFTNQTEVMELHLKEYEP
jgi:GNAT superfamily N-acetyltransferase